MVHDRDLRITAEFWTELWHTLGSRAILVALTIPKQMVKLRDNTKRWSKLLNVYWQSNPCLHQNGVTCCIMLSLPSTQHVAESIGHSPFELVYGEQVRLPVDVIVGNQSRVPDAAHFA